jgi:hypothetical protein
MEVCADRLLSQRLATAPLLCRGYSLSGRKRAFGGEHAQR